MSLAKAMRRHLGYDECDCLVPGTLMCYGQTGAGKTYTMTGATENYKDRGIIPRAITQLFREIDEMLGNVVSVRYCTSSSF